MVGILGYLASSQDREIRNALQTLIQASLDKSKVGGNVTSKWGQEEEEEFTDQQIGTVPFLLYLASLSEMLAATLLDRGIGKKDMENRQ